MGFRFEYMGICIKFAVELCRLSRWLMLIRGGEALQHFQVIAVWHFTVLTRGCARIMKSFFVTLCDLNCLLPDA